jgi:WhiB family redox-sensing transcriptional regulator
MIDLGDTAWMAEGLCAQADPDAWLGDPGTHTAPAVAICRRCPVMAPCRAYALADPAVLGVWGGTTGRDRKHLRVQARQVAA